ncbi:MAG: hypothetical protein DME69_00395 [Verrucomicrobia bacterium]|nr:MAG: hypothetical protein DME69_00395 [Verrucomicrobiota bacterium]
MYFQPAACAVENNVFTDSREIAREHDNRKYPENRPEWDKDAFDTSNDECEPITLSSGKRSTGKSQNESKHCAEQEKKNS